MTSDGAPAVRVSNCMNWSSVLLDGVLVAEAAIDALERRGGSCGGGAK